MESDRAIRRKTAQKSDSVDLQTLNFKVPNSFKREFKVYAAEQGLTMLDLLKEGFELSKKKRGASK
ncbi:hypothetical protein C8J35_1315 [Rhizobium sp. PP-F2F-G38]|uniref:hypothetical protein n=1 Tax=Rhizobium sp. PP-CC-3G-465 TaxID=2135648 RepID=UPI000D98E7E4|nr:hypothetical protein C8J37_1325 [Rhizobium sp. PP-WC-1G-195]PYE39929.1 hypothetical protein DFI02_1205 [Rhizobium sp. PP-F2F-G20b]PYE92080.1 hypothetical protein C8J35_1315 [Rhizobium sp. PP-F2F-G38]TCL89694.1 hypothetical protein C8J38_11164 [Rhizobium sp. PP-WC-2G-219]TCP74744.1 hypothetical protein C8J31_1388 [Rhizobium sp. PP-CC-2G-626]TCQ14827.1 hypothetical protein C8J33_12330 [Rhizobium sp. PP-CC-3G-465]